MWAGLGWTSLAGVGRPTARLDSAKLSWGWAGPWRAWLGWTALWRAKNAPNMDPPKQPNAAARRPQTGQKRTKNGAVSRPKMGPLNPVRKAFAKRSARPAPRLGPGCCELGWADLAWVGLAWAGANLGWAEGFGLRASAIQTHPLKTGKRSGRAA